MAQAKRKKKFFDVNMPILKKDTQLYGYDLKELEGRYIKYDLTRLLRGKGMLLKLKVKVKDDGAFAEPVESIILPFFIKRVMRKGTNYVEDSFSAECKDAIIKIKPLLITRKKVSREVRKALREKARTEIKDYIKDKDSQTLFEDIMKNKLQKSLSLTLKKIYPLSLCEIRSFKIEKEIEPKMKKIVKEEIEKE